MAENSKIGWTTHTFNSWMGCTKVSPGCKFCYAEELMDHRYGKVVWGKGNPRQRTSVANWRKPIQWNKQAQLSGERTFVFCASLADVFDAEVEQAWRDDLWALIESTPNLTWQLLTKRPENVMGMVPETWKVRFPINVWLGTSVENQETADERIPHLLETTAQTRFLSCEPLLGPLDLSGRTVESVWFDAEYANLNPMLAELVAEEGWWINWVIVGGESGAQARPMDIEWARDIRNQCVSAGVPFFMKQLGGKGDKREDMLDLPEDLRIRELPPVAIVTGDTQLVML